MSWAETRPSDFAWRARWNAKVSFRTDGKNVWRGTPPAGSPLTGEERELIVATARDLERNLQNGEPQTAAHRALNELLGNEHLLPD